MSEVMGLNWLKAVEARLWKQVGKEAQAAVVNVLPHHDTRPVLADFYEEYGEVITRRWLHGGESGSGMAGCLRWCMANGRAVSKTWFNAQVYGGGDPNNLSGRLFHLLKHDVEYNTISDYFRNYACTKDAYLDLSQALVVVGLV